MKYFELKYEPVTINGVEYPKYNIYYTTNGNLDNKLFYNTTGVIDLETIIYGYTQKP